MQSVERWTHVSLVEMSGDGEDLVRFLSLSRVRNWKLVAYLSWTLSSAACVTITTIRLTQSRFDVAVWLRNAQSDVDKSHDMLIWLKFGRARWRFLMFLILPVHLSHRASPGNVYYFFQSVRDLVRTNVQGCVDNISLQDFRRFWKRSFSASRG